MRSLSGSAVAAPDTSRAAAKAISDFMVDLPPGWFSFLAFVTSRF
jgi:hypothetical protein